MSESISQMETTFLLQENAATAIGKGNLSRIITLVPETKPTINRLNTQFEQIITASTQKEWEKVLTLWGDIIRDLRVLRGLINPSEEISLKTKQEFSKGLLTLEDTWKNRVANQIQAQSMR